MKAAVFAVAAATLTLACGDDEAGGPRDITAEVSPEIATVVTVRWTTPEPTAGYVEYGPTEALGSITPLDDGASTEHARTLLGLKADTLYHYRVVSQDGSASAVQTVRTSYLPVGLPELTLEGEGHDQFTLVPVLGATKAVTILDADGDIVWYHTPSQDLDVYRARLAVDGESLLYNAGSVSGDPADDSELVRVALDGSSRTSIPLPLLAHDFVEHPDGTLAAIVVEYRDFEGMMLRGDTIVEIDPESGAKSTVWTSWDCFDPAVQEQRGDNLEHGWTFANALDYDPEQDVYYLGMRNFSSIAKIDAESGSCEWVIGLYGRTIPFSPESERFLHQHQFEVRGDRLLVLDNDGSTENVSRVLEYRIDTEANLVTQVWSYLSDPPVYTFVLGEPTRLADGDTFVNWSAAGQLERVTADGESIWKLQSSASFAFGFHTLAPSLYPPGARYPTEP